MEKFNFLWRCPRRRRRHSQDPYMSWIVEDSSLFTIHAICASRMLEGRYTCLTWGLSSSVAALCFIPRPVDRR